MAEYRAKNGFTLADTMTQWGWEIRNGEDIITALEGLPEFETVAAPCIYEALESAVDERKEYANIQELADYITANFI